MKICVAAQPKVAPYSTKVPQLSRRPRRRSADPAIIARHAEAVAWARRMLTRVRALHESAGPSWTKAVRNLAEREALQAGTGVDR